MTRWMSSRSCSNEAPYASRRALATSSSPTNPSASAHAVSLIGEQIADGASTCSSAPVEIELRHDDSDTDQTER